MKRTAMLIAALMLLGVGATIAEAPDSGDPPSTFKLEPRFVRAKPALTEQREGVFRDAVVLKVAQPSRVRLRNDELVSLDRAHEPADLNDLLAGYPGLKITRYFTRPEEELEADKVLGEANTGKELGDLNLYFLLDLRGAAGIDPESFVDELNQLDLVELAYLLEKPEVAPAPRDPPESPDPARNPEAAGNYEPEQGYLDAAPAGIDAEWAWTLTGGRGSNVRFIDIEGAWNLNHDDLPAPFVRIPSTYSVPGPGCDNSLPDPVDVCTFVTNHGTAVIGEVVSINNGWGTTGIASNAQFGISHQSNGTAWPNVANAINLAAAELSAGDSILYEMHSPGPASGEVCLCNCGQFEFIAMEYWQANYDATVAAVALGIHVIEAAGNGSMDLDDARYGGLFDRATRDSGAILVGASEVNNDPRCYTNYGSRVDLHARGTSIVTTGYGDRYSEHALTCPPDANCTDSHDTLFDNNFGGTSGASPIVLGAAAIVQGVSETKYGKTLSPGFMRSVLARNATPQGSPADGNIGPMPNLREAIRADLAPYDPSGWTDSIVARGGAGCTSATCGVTATLPGNSSSTYISYSGRNNGVYETTGFEARLYVDDVWNRWHSWGALNPDSWPLVTNAGPTTVRGGRHTLRVFWDHYDATPEWSETNNTDTRQYIWSPYVLTANTPILRSAPPDRDTTGYSYYNCDGFQATGLGGANSWWVGTAVLPVNAADDYDVRLHEETPTSTAGFGANVAYSRWGAGQSDFVLVNGNQAGSTAVRWPAVLQAGSTPGTGSAVVEFAVGSTINSAVGTHGSYTLGSGQVLDIHEVYFGGAEVGATFDFTLDNVGSADLGFALYDATDTYFIKSGYMTGAIGDALGAGGDETFTVPIPASGYYGLAVWKVSSADRLQTSSYTFSIGETPPDLVPYQAAGWASPLVIRSAAGCDTSTCTDTPTLLGESNLSWFNFLGTNTGPNPSSGTHRTQYYIDDQPKGWMESPNPVAPGGLVYNLDHQVTSILKGGRHTAGMELDVNDGVVESDENNNTYYKQYVWSPYSLTADTPVVRSAPPDRDSTGYSYYNCDGFSYNTSWWGATAVMPVSASDNYDVRLHGDYTGSSTGFGSNLAWSFDGAGQSDFVMVNGNVVGSGTTWYAGLLQGSGIPGAGNAAVHHVTQVVTATPPGLFGGYTIPSGGIISIVELNLNSSAGRTYLINLYNDSGGADLGFGLYDTAGSYFGKSSALISANGTGNGGDEKFVVTIPANGYYGLVVWKNDSTDLSATTTFRVEVLEVLPTFVPDGAGAPGLTVNPTASRLSLTLSWSPDCNQNATTDYTLYTGNLDLLHANGTWDYSAYNPVCNAGQDLVETIAMPLGNSFFLMVPHNGVEEGSYGQDSAGVERPQNPNYCHPQDTSGVCL